MLPALPVEPAFVIFIYLLLLIAIGLIAWLCYFILAFCGFISLVSEQRAYLAGPAEQVRPFSLACYAACVLFASSVTLPLGQPGLPNVGVTDR